MVLKYVKIEEGWDDLKNGSSVTFDLPTSKIYYRIYNSYIDRHWLLTLLTGDGPNREIFDVLEVDSNSFVESVVGYYCDGDFPEVKSLDDLKKVIKALDDECIKKFENLSTSKFKVGDKVRILPRKGNPESYTGNYIDEMLQFVGKTATIRSVVSDSSIRLVDNSWTWDPKALELVDEKEEPKTMDINQVKDGDYLSITNSFKAELNLFPTKKHYQLNFNY